jgi:hypothetical protein
MRHRDGNTIADCAIFFRSAHAWQIKVSRQSLQLTERFPISPVRFVSLTGRAASLYVTEFVLALQDDDVATPVAVLEMPGAILIQAALVRVQVKALNCVACNLNVRNGRDIFHEKPYRLRLNDDALKLAKHF